MSVKLCVAVMTALVVLSAVHAPAPAHAQQLNSLCCYDPTEFTSLNCICLAENEGMCQPYWQSAPLAENITIWDYNQQFCVAYAQYLAENQIQRSIRDLTWESLVNQSAAVHAFDAARRAPDQLFAQKPKRIAIAVNAAAGAAADAAADTDANAAVQVDAPVNAAAPAEAEAAAAAPAEAEAAAAAAAPAPMTAGRAVAVLGDFFAIVKQTCLHSQYAQCVCCSPANTSPCNPGGWDCCSSVVFAPSTGGACAFKPNGACNCQY